MPIIRSNASRRHILKKGPEGLRERYRNGETISTALVESTVNLQVGQSESASAFVCSVDLCAKFTKMALDYAVGFCCEFLQIGVGT
jgi:hypothetical protein